MEFDQRSLYRQHWNAAHATTQSLVELMELSVFNHEGPFICDFCGKIHSSRSALSQHLMIYHKAQMYCDLCPKSFHALSQLERHLLGFHVNIKNVCNVCGFKASHRYILLQHQQKHEPKTECQICHKLVRDIKKHQKMHLKMTCKICSKKIDGNLLKNHVKLCLNESGVQETFLCNLCPKSYHFESDLGMHKQRTHLMNKPYVCDICGFSAAYKSDLEQHMKKHQPMVKCPICHKLVTNIKRHKFNVHEMKKKFYVCDVCGLKSSYKSTLKKHKKIHDPKVKCSICRKLVTDLKTHNSREHPAKNKLYVCDVCGFSVGYKAAFEKHIKTHGPKIKCSICHKLVSCIKDHKYGVHATKNKLHVCDFCGFRAAYKSVLKKHKKIHDPKVKCQICHKLVTNVKSHTRGVHPTENKFYVCDVCGHKAALKSSLKLHIKTHEPKVKCPICHKLPWQPRLLLD